MNVLIDVPDEIIEEVDARVLRAKLETLGTRNTTTAQLNHARELAEKAGVEVANAYLKEVRKRQPAPASRRNMVMRLVQIGFAHIDELTPTQPEGASPEELFPIPAKAVMGVGAKRR